MVEERMGAQASKREGRSGRHSGTAALVGALCLLPFLTTNAIVANRIEPMFSFIRPGPHTSSFEYVLLCVLIGLIAVGAFIAGRPIIDGVAPATRRVLLLNGGVSALLLLAFVTLSIALGSEIYRCDVLGIPNCD
jgi:hypothetical protein